MTTFGADFSSFDGNLTVSWAKQARAAGLAYATHRLYRQGGGLDTYCANNLAALRDGGVSFLGTYGLVFSGMDPIAEADAFLADIERYVPWLLEWPDRFLQVDLEKWPTDPVPAAEGIAYGNRLVDKFDGLVMMYASHGQYSNQLAPWQGLLWNANYGSNPVGEFKAVYPGDNSPGWAPYSGRTPTLLQYGSRTTIAGLTTCDADAFRGTEDQLRAIIRGAQKGGAADMTMIIAVDANHQHYVSDFQTSRKITPQTVNDYVWMAKNHGLALVHNATSPDFVEGGWVHGNWNSETYGPEQTAPSGGGGLSDTDKAAIQGCTDACSATAAAAGDCKTSVDALNSRLSTP